MVGVLVVGMLMVGVLMVGVGGRGRRSGTAVSMGNCVVEGESLKTSELQMDYVSTVPDSKSRQKILMMYFCSKRKINTTLLFAKFDSWPTLKLGLIN